MARACEYFYDKARHATKFHPPACSPFGYLFAGNEIFQSVIFIGTAFHQFPSSETDLAIALHCAQCWQARNATVTLLRRTISKMRRSNNDALQRGPLYAT
jgi:hypothetical protein